MIVGQRELRCYSTFSGASVAQEATCRTEKQSRWVPCHKAVFATNVVISQWLKRLASMI